LTTLPCNTRFDINSFPHATIRPLSTYKWQRELSGASLADTCGMDGAACTAGFDFGITGGRAAEERTPTHRFLVSNSVSASWPAAVGTTRFPSEILVMPVSATSATGLSVAVDVPEVLAASVRCPRAEAAAP